MDRQRKVIYGERRRVLEGADVEEQVRTFIDEVVEGVVMGATQEFAEEWDLEQLWTDLKQIWPVSVDYRQLEEEAGGVANIDRDHLIEVLQHDAQAAYDRREQEVGEEVMRELERRVLLSVLDRKWREHLYEMDYLREGIYLRAYSQRDPLVEYQREGFDMFAVMMDGIKEESVGYLFNLEVSVEDEDGDGEGEELEVEEPMRRVIGDFTESDTGGDDEPVLESGPAEQPNEELESPAAAFVRSPQIRAKGLQQARQPQNLAYSAPSEAGEAEVRGSTVTTADDPFAKVGRNAQCPCGSGKKYKMCHGRPGGPTGLTARAAGG
jgi:preprotein translocase subunit SecA